LHGGAEWLGANSRSGEPGQRIVRGQMRQCRAQPFPDTARILSRSRSYMGWVTAPEEPSAAVEHEHGTMPVLCTLIRVMEECLRYAADNENRRCFRPKDDHVSLEPDG
jgi:hypothetical protein